MKKTLLYIIIWLIPFSLFAQNLEKANELYFDTKIEKSLRAYLSDLKNNPSADVYLNAGFVSTELGDIKQTLKILRKGTNKYPQNFEIKRELAKTYLLSGHYIKAKAIYLELLKNPIPSASDYFNLAVAESNLDNYLIAENYLNRSILLDKYNYLAYFILGQNYEKSNKNSEAIKAYEKVLEIDSSFIKARKKIANLYLKQNQPQLSYDHYKKIVYALPKNNKMAEKIEKAKSELEIPPEEIVLPEGEIYYRKIEKFKISPKIPIIRVGLSTSVDAMPVETDELYFSSSCNFAIASPLTNRKIIQGEKGKIWSVKYDRNTKKAIIFNPQKKAILRFNKSIKILNSDVNTCTTVLHSALFGHATSWAERADRYYRGDMEFFVDNKRKTLFAVNHINLEEYLYSVLPSEMPDYYPTEALKAQAILARTYAMHAMEKKSSFDICDSQKCQVYKGVTDENRTTTEAINQTQGLILTFKDKPIQAVFSSNCGGITQSAEEVWGNHFDYLKPQIDYLDITELPANPYKFKTLFTTVPKAFCHPSENVRSVNYRWAKFVTAENIQSKISNKKDVGKILSVTTVERSKSGHLLKVLVKGTKNSLMLDTPARIKYYLAFGRLKSTSFIIEPYYKGKYISHLIMYGAGWGHSIGFCQSGASGRADAGQDYKQILQHYFPNTTLKSLIK